MEKAAAFIIQYKWEGVLAEKGASLCTGLPAALAHWDSFNAGGWSGGLLASLSSLSGICLQC